MMVENGPCCDSVVTNKSAKMCTYVVSICTCNWSQGYNYSNVSCALMAKRLAGERICAPAGLFAGTWM